MKGEIKQYESIGGHNMIRLRVLNDSGMVIYSEYTEIPKYKWLFIRLSPLEIQNWLDAKKESYIKKLKIWEKDFKKALGE